MGKLGCDICYRASQLDVSADTAWLSTEWSESTEELWSADGRQDFPSTMSFNRLVLLSSGPID